MPERYGDWLQQARWDLEHAKMAAREGHFEWAAFACEQAACKACKGLNLSLGHVAFAHELTLLLEALPPDQQAPPEIFERAKSLNKHYLNARYPSMFAVGTPRQNYTRGEAEEAIANAEAIIEFCERAMGRSKEGSGGP